MKRLFLSVAAACIACTAAAGEGMWLLPYLQRMNIADMQAKGCLLPADAIYSVDKGSLKDAVVIVGGGCTGEIVSPRGLLFTNHHCGYGSIQALSSVENDYLKNGFWAMSPAEEIPAPGLEVRFVRRIVDATADVLGSVPDIAGGEERERMVQARVGELEKRLAGEHPGMEVVVKPFFGGNRYFAFVMEVYTDVRLVGTPPTSIGKFGGDTDNWMWPRHTGDFSIFRVYAGPDNRPAAYSPANVPYRTDNYLKVSLDGYGEGDFAMIMGFPGTTQRYMTSYEIDRMLEVENPQRIFIRGERQAILKERMASSDEVRIQYAAKYAQSSNYWKNSIGMSRGIRKLGVKAQKEAREEAFRQWAAANTLPEEGYVRALDDIRESVEGSLPAFAERQFLSEAFLRAVELLRIASSAEAARPGKRGSEAREAAERKFRDFYKDYDPETDRRVARRMVEIAYEHLKERPSFYAEWIEERFLGDAAAYVDWVYDNSVFADEARGTAYLKKPSEKVYRNDPAVAMYRSIAERYEAARAEERRHALQFADGHRRYIAGLMRMEPDRPWASDANFTIRLTYGNVLPYRPCDGVKYDYRTTLKGVIEKEDPKNPEEFTVPEKLKSLYAARDFGCYADARGELPTCFLADCDITGGNSGSPVMNARGELIGLAFDGNWEAMSGDVAFEPELQRTIAVDIRYVLFIVDKFAGAGWLLEELGLERN